MDYRAPAPDAPLLVVGDRVIALDRTTGAPRWQYDVKANPRKFALTADRFFLLDAETDLHCLDLRTGALLGKVKLGFDEAHTMLLDGDRLYVSGQKVVAALDLNGQLLWQSAVPYSAMAGLGGLAVVGGNMVQIDFARR